MIKLTSKEEDYSKWYNEIILKSGIAESSDIHGCMIIKPYGFAIWESIKEILNKMLKKTGHENAYFPLLIPKSYFLKESSHIKYFAKECAVVTHYRLKSNNNDLIVDENSKLGEELIIRPTSETIIWKSYNKWIQSYRDLPILINQWSNVIRWEMTTRLFLRNSEFLWQEGHTAHSNKYEAIKETLSILDIYSDLLQNFLSIPIIKGIKSENEKFAGSEKTYCLESIMQNGKALQVATSHFLGQNFSKAFNVKFISKDGKEQYVWGSSWGVSTRLIGALIMTHSDNNGLILPPLLAPIQVIIIPIYKKIEKSSEIDETSYSIKKHLIKMGIRVKFDNRKFHTPGWKFNEYEIKGVPIRICIGPDDIKNNTIEIFRRDILEKKVIKKQDLFNLVPRLLSDIQKYIFNKAKKKHDNYISYAENYDSFKSILKEKGGFVLAHWDNTIETENKIKNETKATIRCIPLIYNKEVGKCIFSGKRSNKRVYFAKSY